MSPDNALLIRGRSTRTVHIGLDDSRPACGKFGADPGFFPMGRLDCTDHRRAVRGLLAIQAGPGELCPLCFTQASRLTYLLAYNEWERP